MNDVRYHKLLRVFYGLSACSWMPHWACHYYRLETKSTFVVGTWSFSSTDSVLALIAYSVLVAINLASISVEKLRSAAAGLSGICHLSLGLLHAYRLVRPFTFEVFGYSWSYGASLREVLIVVPFSLLSLYVALAVRPRNLYERQGHP